MSDDFYYKYIGLKDGVVRTDFFMGLFRFTPPRELNDPHEVNPEILVNTYSDEDQEEARQAAIVGSSRSEPGSLRICVRFGIHPSRPRWELRRRRTFVGAVRPQSGARHFNSAELSTTIGAAQSQMILR